jgi:hypothetical protein
MFEILNRLFSGLRQKAGRWLAAFLNKPLGHYNKFSVVGQETLKQLLRPGDILLVEGDTRFSVAIKYLTQSTWSHAALYVGDISHIDSSVGTHAFIEADVETGVIAIPIDKYEDFNVRICRPVDLTPEDEKALIDFAISRLGHTYDLKNVFDLMRYLLPTPPIPSQFRRKLLGFGSGDPTRAICSTMLAQCFQSIHYPILPRSGEECVIDPESDDDKEIFCLRPYTHFTPRDFDLSPYFQIVKPTLMLGFHYQSIRWQRSKEDSEH